MAVDALEVAGDLVVDAAHVVPHAHRRALDNALQAIKDVVQAETECGCKGGGRRDAWPEVVPALRSRQPNRRCRRQG